MNLKYKVTFSSEAEKNLRKIDRVTAGRIFISLVLNNELIIFVVRIGPRGDIYNDIKALAIKLGLFLF